MLSKLNLKFSELELRILEKPNYLSWEFPSEDGGGKGVINLKGNINYEELNDHEKMMLYIFAWNLSGCCPSKRSLMKEFNWSDYRVSKMYKELKMDGLKCVPTFSEETGLLSGKGYYYDIS